MEWNKVVTESKKQISDTTALLTVYTPMYSLMEVTVAKMPHEVSEDARVLGFITGYLGIGYLIGKGRDISRNYFNITEETSKRAQKIHDTAYLAATAVVINPPFYLAAGSRDSEEIFWGTAAGAVLGMIAGAPVGYTIDLFRELTGIEESKRTPQFLKNANSTIKKTVAAGMVAGSLALWQSTYQLLPDNKVTLEQKTTEEYNEFR